MKIYVASKFENVEEVREAFRLLRAAGHEITHDWTVESVGTRTGPELKEFLENCAHADFMGVTDADILLLINHPLGKGMWVEMGMALAFRIPILAVFPERSDNIFMHLPEVAHFDSIQQAINSLR